MCNAPVVVEENRGSSKLQMRKGKPEMTNEDLEKRIDATSQKMEEAINAFGRPGYDPSIGMVRGKTRLLHEIPAYQELIRQSGPADSDHSHDND